MAATTQQQPNLIWIFGDQHRGQALSAHGDSNVNTPEIDRMIAEGTDFGSAVAGCPLCCPFRGSLLTGQYPHRAVPGHEFPLPQGARTVAHYFGDHGYETAWFGKWHVAGLQESKGRTALRQVPKEQRGGFDTWIGYENNNAQYDCWVHGHDGGTEIANYRLDGYETDALTDLLLQFLEDRAGQPENSARPFFASLSVQPPHDPYVAPPADMARHNPQAIALRPNVPRIPSVEWPARRELAGYYGMIENLDANVGRVRAALRRLGLEENTWIIFFSDHGDMHGSQGQFRKTSPWEEAIRIPFVVARGGTPYGYRSWSPSRAPVNHVDIVPTSLGLCGLKVPDELPGHDYSPRIGKRHDSGNEPDSAFLQLVEPTRHGDSTDRAWRGIVTTDGWKYICLEHQPWLLFNLNDDPYEQRNLAHNSKYDAQRKKLHDRLAQWISETGDSFALPELPPVK